MADDVGADRLAALLEAMLASSLDAVVTVDASGRVLTFNSAAEQIFGYRAVDTLGRNIAELIIPPSLRPRHYSSLARHLETGERTIMNRRVEVTGMRADGSEFPVELTVTRVPLEGPPTFTAYLRDITERKRTESELLASRVRVVESADRERRRIERNLHDGAQQHLLTIGVLLRQLAMDGDTPAALLELIELAQEETGIAIAELRALAQGIHPAAVTEGGLPSALRGLALRIPLEVTVDLDEMRLPDSVEIALFYVATEALSNVVKYAEAETASLSLRVTDDMARLQIIDDGVGGADPARGSGLAGLVDRLEAIGGNLTIVSSAGSGTTVTAVAPAR